MRQSLKQKQNQPRENFQISYLRITHILKNLLSHNLQRQPYNKENAQQN